MAVAKRRETIGVMVGNVQVGGGAPVVVQSMTNTDTADAESTAKQVMELAGAGSELVRVTVNVPKAAEAVGEIVRRIRDAGYTTPIVGDFHYNGHKLLAQYPDCASALDKYRINHGQGVEPRRQFRDHLQDRGRPRQTRPDRRQHRLAEPRTRPPENAGKHR